MTVLVTNMGKTLRTRNGYISPDDYSYLNYNTIDRYIFNTCIKIKGSPKYTHWVCYWDDLPFAMKCKVQCTKLITGYIQVVILTKELVPLTTIGQNPFKAAYGTGSFVGDKLVSKTDEVQEWLNEIEQNPSKYGLEKPKKEKKKPIKLGNSYTEEEIEHYKKLIFGS